MASPGAGLAQAVGGPEILSDSRYPIAAWWPPPPVPKGPDDSQKTDALYRELAGAGFDTVVGGNGVGNDRANGLALGACAANGLRFLLSDTALRNAIDGTATAPAARNEAQEEPRGVLQALTEQDSRQDLRAQAAADPGAVSRRISELHARFGEHPALSGVLLYDEPHGSLFGILRYAKAEIGRVFGGDELPYANVWPSYASPRYALGAPSYAEYLERYMNGARYPSAVAPPVLSFDHYPLLASGLTTPDFFYNHAVIRNFSRRFGVPSWGFVQSVGFDGRAVGLGVRRSPDEAEVFWQINVALAYGVKGIQYFTYWTPENNGVRFSNAMITRAGTRTPLYAYAQRANGYLRRVGAALLPLTSTSVTHFGEDPLPRGAQPFRGNPYVRAAAGSPVILSFFNKPGAPAERYVLVVNRSPDRSSTTRLTVSALVKGVESFDPAAGGSGAFVRANLGGTPPRYLYPRLGPGRARLYRLRTA